MVLDRAECGVGCCDNSADGVGIVDSRVGRVRLLQNDFNGLIEPLAGVDSSNCAWNTYVLGIGSRPPNSTILPDSKLRYADELDNIGLRSGETGEEDDWRSRMHFIG